MEIEFTNTNDKSISSLSKTKADILKALISNYKYQMDNLDDRNKRAVIKTKLNYYRRQYKNEYFEI